MSIMAKETTSINNNLAQAISKNNNKGFAYNDEYGFAHVVKEYETALKYSGDGKIYSFEGKFGGGYALDSENNRASLPLPNTKPYGNDVRDGEKPEKSEGSFVLLEHLSRMEGVGYNLQIPDLGVLDDKDEKENNYKYEKVSQY